MGLLNALQTSVSGMAAQSSFLSSIGDNIANSGTTGYKEATVAFETVLGQQQPGSYESGGVQAQTQYGITTQGTLNSTTSSTDLAIEGGGFFVVTNGGSGADYLTRAGSFSPDTNGNLVNTAGYTLMGYAVNSSTGLTSSTLSSVNIKSSTLQATATSGGTLNGNLPSTDASGTVETSGVFNVYDDLGTAQPLTMSYTNNGNNSWTANALDANSNVVGSATLQFDPTSGALTSGSPLTITIPSSTGSATNNTITIPVGMTQLASGFSSQPTVNGQAPSSLSSVKIGTDGTVTGIFASGATSTLYKLPVATVTSPNNLTSINDDVYQQNTSSGTLELNTPGTGAAGTIQADNLEASTVDLATELTNMIVAQRAYEANSKVLQAASDLLSKLDNIQTG